MCASATSSACAMAKPPSYPHGRCLHRPVPHTAAAGLNGAGPDRPGAGFKAWTVGQSRYLWIKGELAIRLSLQDSFGMVGLFALHLLDLSRRQVMGLTHQALDGVLLPSMVTAPLHIASRAGIG